MVKFTIWRYDQHMDDRRKNDNGYFDQIELRVFNALKRKLDLSMDIVITDYEMAYLMAVIDFINKKHLRLNEPNAPEYTDTERGYFKDSQKFMQYFNKGKYPSPVKLWSQYKAKLLESNINV